MAATTADGGSQAPIVAGAGPRAAGAGWYRLAPDLLFERVDPHRVRVPRPLHDGAAGPRPRGSRRVIRAIVFDLDNTLTDFMRMKEAAIQAAIDGMIDAGLDRTARRAARSGSGVIYDERGLEFQQVFDELLEREFGEVDPKILASGIVAYRRARESDAGALPARADDAARTGQARHPARAWSPTRRALQVVAAAVRARTPAPVRRGGDVRRHGRAQARARRRSARCCAGSASSRAESLMIGDWAERDVVGARSLGMKTVFARYGDTFDTQGVRRGFRCRTTCSSWWASSTGLNGRGTHRGCPGEEERMSGEKVQCGSARVCMRRPDGVGRGSEGARLHSSTCSTSRSSTARRSTTSSARCSSSATSRSASTSSRRPSRSCSSLPFLSTDPTWLKRVERDTE